MFDTIGHLPSKEGYLLTPFSKASIINFPLTSFTTSSSFIAKIFSIISWFIYPLGIIQSIHRHPPFINTQSHFSL
jgi:hypothetical protein